MHFHQLLININYPLGKEPFDNNPYASSGLSRTVDLYPVLSFNST